MGVAAQAFEILRCAQNDKSKYIDNTKYNDRSRFLRCAAE
jgi:hypothetical protein